MNIQRLLFSILGGLTLMSLFLGFVYLIVVMKRKEEKKASEKFINY